MKKHTKKILGLFALAAVATTTVFAAFLPVPGAQAEETSTVTDTITVKVIGTNPTIDPPEGITSGSKITSPEQHLTIPYSNIETLGVDVTYKDVDGTVYNFPLFNPPFDPPLLDVNYADGELSLDINLLTGEYTYTYTYADDDGVIHTSEVLTGQMPHYGYGEYSFSIHGTGSSGDTTVSTVDFTYQPVDAHVTVDPETGKVTVNLDYDYDDGGGGAGGAGQVSRVEIEIRDPKTGEVIFKDEFKNGNKSLEFYFAEKGLDPGTYEITLTAYDARGNMLYKPYVFTFTYTLSETPVPAAGPDTGGLLGNLNISKVDYLATGLAIFLLVGVSSAVFIMRKGKSTSRRRRK